MPSRTTRTVTAALAAVALAVPAAGASAATQDLRSPDARDSARGAVLSTGGTQDLRSPDARDAGRPATPVPAPAPVSSITVAEPGGFDWTSAAIGAGFIAALMLLASGVTVGVRHHHRGKLAL